MVYNSITSALLGYKGNRGFQDFEQWQEIGKIITDLFGKNDNSKVLLNCIGPVDYPIKEKEFKMKYDWNLN
jgi:hypothetical protein